MMPLGGLWRIGRRPYSPKCVEETFSEVQSRILHSPGPNALETRRYYPLHRTGPIYILWCWIKMHSHAYPPPPSGPGLTAKAPPGALCGRLRASDGQAELSPV
jgi:hypothetical protein